MADIQTLWQMAQAQENNRHPVAGVLSSIAGGMKKAYDEKPQREMQRLEMAAKLLQIQKEQQAMAQQQEANRQIQEYQAFQQRTAANGQLGLDMYKPNPFDKRTTGKFSSAINDEGSLLGKLMDASDYSAMSRKWDDPNKKISVKYGPNGTTMDVDQIDPIEREKDKAYIKRLNSESGRVGAGGDDSKQERWQNALKTAIDEYKATKGELDETLGADGDAKSAILDRAEEIYNTGGRVMSGQPKPPKPVDPAGKDDDAFGDVEAEEWLKNSGRRVSPKNIQLYKKLKSEGKI